MTEDEMAGWHHRLNGHEFEWTPGVGDRPGGLACYGPWGCKESASSLMNQFSQPCTIKTNHSSEREARVPLE